MKLIDSHAHLNFEAFAESYREVLERAQDAGVEKIINVGSRYDNSVRAVEQAKEFPDMIFPAVGFHPDHLKEIEDIAAEVKKYQKLLTENKVVAIGEIGLDNYYFESGINEDTPENRKKETDIFRAFLDLAVSANLPVIIHSRDAEENTLKILAEYPPKLKKGGVVHCFTGGPEYAKKILDLGFYIGFTGFVTFEQAKFSHIRESVKVVPLERMLVETDAPFLAPEPHRGETNEPAYVAFVARKIAEIKGVSVDEVAEKTTACVKKLFDIA